MLLSRLQQNFPAPRAYVDRFLIFWAADEALNSLLNSSAKVGSELSNADLSQGRAFLRFFTADNLSSRILHLLKQLGGSSSSVLLDSK